MVPGMNAFSTADNARFPVLLHYYLARHLGVDCAVIRIRSRLGKGVREPFVCIEHLGLEHAFCTDRRMGNIIMVGPSNCCSNRYRDRLRPKNEIIYLYVRVC